MPFAMLGVASVDARDRPCIPQPTNQKAKQKMQKPRVENKKQKGTVKHRFDATILQAIPKTPIPRHLMHFSNLRARSQPHAKH